MRKRDISIYVDEAEHLTYFSRDYFAKFFAIGCLAVENQYLDTLYEHLQKMRCLHNPPAGTWYDTYEQCPVSDCRKEWHRMNDTEIHFRKLDDTRNSASTKIAQRWVQYFVDNFSRSPLWFSLLYIDETSLDPERFGRINWTANAYSRLFRSNIKYLLASVFQNSTINIIRIIHDRNYEMEHHRYFPELNIKHLEAELNDENGKFAQNRNIANAIARKIEFVESDHRNVLQPYKKDSVLLQFTDLLIGSTSEVIFMQSRSSAKSKVAEIVAPLVFRVLGRDKNKRYNTIHAGYNISFARGEFKTEPVKQQNLDGQIVDIPDQLQFHRGIRPRFKFGHGTTQTALF